MSGKARIATAFLAFFFAPLTAYGDDAVTAQTIISGDEIALKDGRILRLAGIKALSPDAAMFLNTNISGRDLSLQNAVIDRYGRLQATAFLQGRSLSVEDMLLGAGLAFVYPAGGDEAQLDDMLGTEKTARREKRGYWADHPDISAAAAGALYGKYGFVTGAVVKAERVKNKVYLNFGPDWRTDFTVTIAAHDLRVFKKQGIDPLTLQGKILRVRGWVKRDFGPMITVTDPHQLEIL